MQIKKELTIDTCPLNTLFCEGCDYSCLVGTLVDLPVEENRGVREWAYYLDCAHPETEPIQARRPGMWTLYTQAEILCK